MLDPLNTTTRASMSKDLQVTSQEQYDALTAEVQTLSLEIMAVEDALGYSAVFTAPQSSCLTFNCCEKAVHCK
jgi:hypothetical protein